MSEYKDQIDRLRELASSLRLSNLKNHVQEFFEKAEKEQISPICFLEEVLKQEWEGRYNRACKRRIKESCLSYIKTLEEFELERISNLSVEKMQRLAGLTWIEEGYNLFLTGMPGTGKTHLACALAYQAILEGYATSFITMHDLLELLKEPPINERSMRRLNKIRSSQLLVIDGVGDFPVSSLEASLFLNLVNQLHETCSLILTGNHGPDTWPELFENNSQLLAALDRLMFKCEVVGLDATSYRVEHRMSFLD